MRAWRFTTWTRRRMGMAAGGMVAACTGLVGLPEGVAGKKKKRYRCRRVLQGCQVGSKKKRCCKHLTCGRREEQPDLHCCRETQVMCEIDGECCGELRCTRAVGLAGNRCCADAFSGFGACTVDQDCCDNDFAFCNNQNVCERVS